MVYKFSRATARLKLSVSLREIMGKSEGEKSKKKGVYICVCALAIK